MSTIDLFAKKIVEDANKMQFKGCYQENIYFCGLFCYITCTLKRSCLRLFRFRISQFVPFLIRNPQNLSKICKKGTNCVLYQNNRRLLRLKVHVI